MYREDCFLQGLLGQKKGKEEMKKVMMFMAIAVCAVSVQAANIVWANGGYPIGDLSGTAITSTVAGQINLVVNLINVTQGDKYMGSFTGINTMTPGSMLGTDTVYTLGTDAYVNDVFRVEMYATFVVGGKSVDYWRVIENTAWKLVAADGAGSRDVFAWSGPGFSDTGWMVVPEPTSMALLALGAAAFGLRRRFRK